MNKFRRFLGRISPEACLKMDYFVSKSPKIAKRWLFPQPPFNQVTRNICKALIPLKFLVDADAWQIWGKIKLIFCILCPPPIQKTFSHHCCEKLLHLPSIQADAVPGPVV